MNKSQILNEIKLTYNIKSNAEFARRLGISPQNLSNWYKRETFDENLILRKFTDVNEAWLLNGEGEMIKPAQNPFSQMTEEEIGGIVTKTFTEELMKQYEKGEIYPAAIHDKIVAEKDKIIKDLQREVWDLQKRIEELTK